LSQDLNTNVVELQRLFSKLKFMLDIQTWFVEIKFGTMADLSVKLAIRFKTFRNVVS